MQIFHPDFSIRTGILTTARLWIFTTKPYFLPQPIQTAVAKM